jgi:cbb3-type cytochrome oxidase subunit 3
MSLMGLIVWMMRYSVVGVGLVFIMIMLTTYWPGRKARIERNGCIPLEDDR